MRIGRRYALAFGALLSGISGDVLAQATTAASTVQTSPQALAKYDANKNGVLDSEELAAMRADEAKIAAAMATSAANTNGEDKVVELSPFEVNATDDRGYYAANTMSGTRLNSRIEDLAASITVVTKQQLLDTAATDLNDIFLYEANTEGTGQFTDFGVDRDGNVDDRIQRVPNGANRVRGIGAANIAVGNFASTSRVPIDTYNVDSAEISRGANSNLFGLGEGTGTVNLNTSRANLARTSTQVKMQVDDRGSNRWQIDLNRPIVRNRLSVRLSAVYDSKEFTRKPSYDITRRVQGTVTYRPFSKTTLRGTYESFHQIRQSPNSIMPRDGVSEWLAAGMPTWDPVTFRPRVNGVQGAPIPVGSGATAENTVLPKGLMQTNASIYSRPIMFIEPDGSVPIWMQGRLGTNANPNNNLTRNERFISTGNDILRFRAARYPLFNSPSVSTKALYDWEDINATAINWERNKTDIYSFEIEQQLLPNLNAQVAWRIEDSDQYSRNIAAGNFPVVLQVDVNERLLDGSANPFFLRPYILLSDPQFSASPEYNDNFRTTLAYDLDLRRHGKFFSWLGRHRAGAYYESRRLTSGTWRMKEAVLDAHTWNNPANLGGGPAFSRMSYRYYVGDNQGYNIDYAPAKGGQGGQHTIRWYNGATNQWISEQAFVGDVGTNTTNSRREVTSRGATLQSFFWDDRIITTLGKRRDLNETRQSQGATINPATGLLDYSTLNRWNAWTERRGKTDTKGIVVKPLRWLALHYNTANSFNPQSFARTLFGDPLPDPTGESKDYGFSLNLAGGRFVSRVNFYRSNTINARNGDAGIVATRAIRIENGNGDDFNLEDFVTAFVTARPENATKTADEIATIVESITKVPTGATGSNVSETSDILSKGVEVELYLNPTDSWTIKFTGAQQQTIDDHLSPNLGKYLEMRLPVWQSIKDDNGVLWWTNQTGDGTAEAFYTANVLAPFKVATANQGKPRTQVREFSWSLTSSYKFDRHEGWIKNLTVGGSARWQSKGSIGFYGIPDSDGVMRSLDKNRPIWDPARLSGDVWGRYGFRLFRGKVPVSAQLNIRNIQQGKSELRTASTNPDGTPNTLRIIDPRQYVLSLTFDL
jgi:hypothetical protein